MAIINFPNNPSIGQPFTINGKTYIWDGVRWLINSRSPSAVSITLDEVYYASSETAMLALTSKQGDICVRTDENPNRSYKQKTVANGLLANWQALGMVGSNYGKI